jgi:hypothetical protein
MAPVWYLPQGEEEGRPAALILPVRHAAGSLISGRAAGTDKEEPTMTTAAELTGVVAEHIRAVNAHDTDAIVATFAPGAYVNDARREFAGIDAIRRWVEREMTGDKVTIEVREVLDHYGDTIVRGAYDGQFDKTNLPDEVVLTNYFSVRDGQIVSLVVVFNQPAAY